MFLLTLSFPLVLPYVTVEGLYFRHTQIKFCSVSLSLRGNRVRFLNSLLFFLYVCVCVCMCYSLFHRQQMLEGVRSSNSQTSPFRIALYSDWFTSVGQRKHGGLLIYYSTLTYILQSLHICVHMGQAAGIDLLYCYINKCSYWVFPSFSSLLQWYDQSSLLCRPLQIVSVYITCINM